MYVEKFLFDASYEAKIYNRQSKVKADKKRKAEKKRKLKLKLSNAF